MPSKTFWFIVMLKRTIFSEKNFLWEEKRMYFYQKEYIQNWLEISIIWIISISPANTTVVLLLQAVCTLHFIFSIPFQTPSATTTKRLLYTVALKLHILNWILIHIYSSSPADPISRSSVLIFVECKRGKSIRHESRFEVLKRRAYF